MRFVSSLMSALLFLGYSISYALDCPDYVHKDDVIAGVQSELPDGYFVFSTENGNGLYISDLNNFNPQKIPNTSGTPELPSISLDGRWIMYNIDNTPYMIQRDGSHKTTVPVTTWGRVCKFFHYGPYGPEIYYCESNKVIKAREITLGENSVSFGKTRTIANFGWKGNLYTNNIGAAKDQILAGVKFSQHGNNYRTSYITIPNGGKGTATIDHVYQWENDDWETLYGCGLAISPDGSFACQNGGWLGSACSPTKWTSPEPFDENLAKDHKGFYLTPFRYYTDDPIPYTENDITDGISSNWIPEEWRFGNWAASSFHSWYVGNNNQYVIGVQGGQSPDARNGVWICKWSNNAWTLLTTPDEQTISYKHAAVHFDEKHLYAAGTSQRLSASGNLLKLSMTSTARAIHFTCGELSGSSVEAAVYSLSGGKIAGLSFADGSAVWDKRNRFGQTVASGVYFLRVSAPGNRTVSHMMVLSD